MNDKGTPRRYAPEPDPWRTRQDASVLGQEIDWLRLYGWTKADIANHLHCTVSAVEKWISRHPQAQDPWQVSA